MRPHSHTKESLGAALLLILSIGIQSQNAASARTQWEIQHPNSLPGQDARFIPPGSDQLSSQVPALSPGQFGSVPGQMGGANQMPGQMGANQMPGQIPQNFWKGQMPVAINNRVAAGIVLTGIMEHTISSGKSLPGDTFAILLEDGFAQNGMQVIPLHSKIIGTVTTVTPAKRLRVGMPGQIQVALQSLVMPDGSHVPFAGFIDSNPAHAFKKAPKKRNLGFDIADTGKNLMGGFGGLTDGMGWTVARRHRGNEFILEEGEAVPIRLNRSITVPESVVRPVQMAAPGQAGFAPGSAIPGLPVQPMPANSIPYGTPSTVPGLVGDDVFGKPVGATPKSLNDMPEPF